MARQGIMRLRVGEAPNQTLQPTAGGISVLHRSMPLPPPAAAELLRSAAMGSKAGRRILNWIEANRRRMHVNCLTDRTIGATPDGCRPGVASARKVLNG